MPKKESKCDWIVLDYNTKPNKWKCLRCGEAMEQPDNIKLVTALNLMNAFLESHKKCREKIECSS